MSMFDVACDVGGGFVDLVAHRAGAAPVLLKRPRDPDTPLPVLIAGMLREAGVGRMARLRLSTTLATNALASGTACPAALVTTAGFTGLPELGRQSRRDPDRQDPQPPTPAWLSPPHWRFGITGRIGADAKEADPLSLDGLDRFLATLPRDTPVAICLLFAPLNPAHEIAVAAAIGESRPDLQLSLSYRVDPALREFERMLATLADAALKPFLTHALAGLPAPWVLRADGMLAPLDAALAAPLRLAMSGPAGGALAVGFWSEGDAIGLDMGSTTTEVSLARDGKPLTAREIGVGDLRLRCAALDIESLAVGGGTALEVTRGRIRLGASCKPACQGGPFPTLTDAALLAGWLPDSISGVALDREAAAAAFLPLGRDPTPALELAEATIAEATRRIALRRGIDPVRALLVLGGGAGPLHGCAIATRIGARHVLLPPAPGLLSAYGLLLALAGESRERVCDLPLEALTTLEPAPGPATHMLEMAYAGQTETLTIAWQPGEPVVDVAARFDAEHAARRGHAPGGARRIMAVRSTLSGPLGPAPLRPPPSHRLPAPRHGPALLHGADATLRIPPGWHACQRNDGAIILRAS